MNDESSLLATIAGPRDLKGLGPDERERLARELRGRIAGVVSKNGGHFGSNLGVVELTIALHTVFDSPRDRIVWDVSHQCYPHKLLTGRDGVFDSLRTYGGTSGFCHKGESEHDTAFAGHAGTATSIALGIAQAHAATGLPHHVISVVGDASLVSGMTLEALNHAGWLKTKLIIILNDNGMSISFPVGGLHQTLTGCRATGTPTGNPYTARSEAGLPPGVGHQDVRPFFERLGLRYEGPFDGHDAEGLIATLERLKTLDGPTLLHLHTRKGHGWEPAIEDPIGWHAAKGFLEPQRAAFAAPVAPAAKKLPTWTQAFTKAMLDLAREDERLVAITAAMLGGTGLEPFAKAYPARTYDAGIAEQHATGFASGMRLVGLRPVLAIYSTFLQRGYDQVVHDVALQGNPLVLAMDRGGLVGDDGVTHQGLFDISYLRCIPDVLLCAPADEAELRAMLRWGIDQERLVGIRWPRDTVPDPSLLARTNPPVELGKGVLVRGGEGDVAFFAYGAMVEHSLRASDRLAEAGVAASVANARFAKPIDVELLVDLLERHEVVITVEDHALEGGFGSACLQAVLERRPELTPKLRLAGVPDEFVHHGARPLQLRDAGLDVDGLVARVRAALPVRA